MWLKKLVVVHYCVRVLIRRNERQRTFDPSMMKCLNDIAKFPEQDKEYIFYALDAMINNVKLKAIG